MTGIRVAAESSSRQREEDNMAATWMARGAVARIVTLCAAPVLAASVALAQAPGRSADVTFPANAHALEGLPQVRIDLTKEKVVRRELAPAEAAKSRLTIQILDGRFYWGDRTGVPLTLTKSGSFTYLSSTEPGRYIRIQEINDTLSYIEHVDMAFGSVTYWGELRVVLEQ
jgi:hypothetical protein